MAAIFEKKGWKCPYSDKVFRQEELTGYGNPPRSPGCPPGYGQGAPMILVDLPVEAQTETKTKK